MADSSGASCTEKFGDKVEGSISGFFNAVGSFVGRNPLKAIALCFLLTALCGIGFLRFKTENRGDELWVPQGTTAEEETNQYEIYFASTSRFNNLILQGKASTSNNVLSKDALLDALRLHKAIATGVSTVDGEDYTLPDLCTRAGGSCISESTGVCQCFILSIFRQWNYDLATLEADRSYLETLNNYGTREDLDAVLGNPVFDDNDRIVSAEALAVSYYLEDRSFVEDGSEEDPINEAWEEVVFLATVESAEVDYPNTIHVDYSATRSFADELGDAINADIFLVNISYILAFLYLSSNIGNIRCGRGSRRTLALGALLMVGLSTAAGLGLSSAFGLFFGPVHSILPFIVLGIGVDDVFVIVNAFDRERKVSRKAEDNDALAVRSGAALGRAGASITVTSATDLVAFGISSSSAFPALSSFCAYAAISIFFLWVFASTFFTGALVLDERRQRENRRDCLVCLKRKQEDEDDDEDGQFEEGRVSRYFRNYHAPAVLSKVGKLVILVVFAGLFALGIFGAINLPVENTERQFIPDSSYLKDYLDATDQYFPSRGIDFVIVFEGGSDIYATREELAALDSRLTGLSTQSPWIAEPVTELAYRNVMDGLKEYLTENGSQEIGNVTLDSDNWPTTVEDFELTLSEFTSFSGPGSEYAQDVSFSEDGRLRAYYVKSEYVSLTKTYRGKVVDDADRQIDAMDDTRRLVASWDDLPPSFPYSESYFDIERFKVIQKELYQNVGLAVLSVGVIVFFTVASPVTSILITLNVALCLVEILGFMYLIGIVIDSVSVINLTLAVGLSVDYSAHIGHAFMMKGGDDKNQRAIESLADLGAAVLSGALSTFLAVVVLLFSSSYVFEVLSRQFTLTVLFGLLHGLVLLPVLLSLCGPKAFSSAEIAGAESKRKKEEEGPMSDDQDEMGPTIHPSAHSSAQDSYSDMD